MAEDKKKVTKEVEKPAIKKTNGIVTVENKSNKSICTSKGVIKPGETGKCTEAEARSYGRFLSKK